jgi:hypothetical protein
LPSIDPERSSASIAILLARHRVEHEPSADLGDALRSFGDDYELNDRQNEEDHAAHDVVAANDKCPEGADHLTGVGLEQNEPRRRDVERESKERRQQEQRRKRGDADRVRDVENDEEDGDRRRQVRRDEEIERPRRKGHDHEPDDENDDRRERDIGEGEGAAPCERDGESARCHAYLGTRTGKGGYRAYGENSRSTSRPRIGLYSNLPSS